MKRIKEFFPYLMLLVCSFFLWIILVTPISFGENKPDEYFGKLGNVVYVSRLRLEITLLFLNTNPEWQPVVKVIRQQLRGISIWELNCPTDRWWLNRVQKVILTGK